MTESRLTGVTEIRVKVKARDEPAGEKHPEFLPEQTYFSFEETQTFAARYSRVLVTDISLFG